MDLVHIIFDNYNKSAKTLFKHLYFNIFVCSCKKITFITISHHLFLWVSCKLCRLFQLCEKTGQATLKRHFCNFASKLPIFFSFRSLVLLLLFCCKMFPNLKLFWALTLKTWPKMFRELYFLHYTDLTAFYSARYM